MFQVSAEDRQQDCRRYVPVIETERLRLRGHRMDDFAACAAMWADPVVIRYLGGKPFSREDAWGKLLRTVGHWSWLGFGHWAVEEKATGSFIGEVGFVDYKREMEPSLGDAPEIGWVFAAQGHGKGYATEAARAAIEWGEAHFGPVETVCIIHPENTRSGRVAEKCGYREVRMSEYKGQPARVLVR